MHTVGDAGRSAERLGKRYWILAALVILGSMSGVTSAQIDVNETGLHDGEIVYGFEVPGAPIPYTNLDAITLWGWGEADLNLYADVSFYAYGLSSDVNLVNVGAVEVNAVGGIANINDGNAYAGILDAGGIRVSGDVNNTGNITVNAAGGTANAHGDLAVADATADAQGIFSSGGSIANGALINVDSVGGTATGEYSASAEGNAYGIHLDSGTVTNSGALDVRMVGGTAHGVSSFEGDPDSAVEAYADANTVGYGILAQHVVNMGEVYVNGNGGQAEAQTHVDIYGSAATGAYARADAETYGIYATADVNNVVTVQAIAIGGSATADADVDASAWAGASALAYASSDANAYGLYSGTDVVNTGHIMASIIASNADALASIDIGDTQEAEANPSAFAYGRAGGYGIYAGDDVDNIGLIAVITNGGAADANAMVERAYLYGPAYVHAAADANMAVYGIRAGGEVDNSANVILITAGHHANAHADADITARAWAEANADANSYAIHARGDIDGTGNVNIMASGGTTQADARAADEAYASASADAVAYGIYSSEESVASAGSMAIDATGSTAHATAASDGDASAVATANADAYGIYAAENASNGGTMHIDARAGAAHADANAPSDAYAYAIADASAYGVYAEADAANSSHLDIWAVGGTAEATAVSEGATHFAVSANGIAYGLYAGGDANNTGAIDVNAVGGDATTLSDADPNADAYAVGIRAADAVTSSGELTVAATGGTVDANESSAHANAGATGISTAGTTSNTGDIIATAIGGTATSDYYAEVTASATGITTSGSDADIYNSGALTIITVGGTATFDGAIENSAWADTGPYTDAYGISTTADVDNSGQITVVAHGGTGTANTPGDPDHYGYTNLYSSAEAIGISAYDVNNTAAITATADGGTFSITTTGLTTATVSNSNSAIGIQALGDVTNSGAISAMAVDADVSATSEGFAYAFANPSAYGIYADGNVTNSGAITVQAFAGIAHSSSNAYASSYGVGVSDIDPSQDVRYLLANTGAITVTSAGGEAEAQDDSLDSAATAQAYGIVFCGDVANSADITTLAVGGTVDTNNTAYAYAYTTGISTGAIMLDEGEDVVPMVLTNSGAITGTALGGTADSNGLTDTYAGAVGVAFQGSVDNDGTITVTAIGGTADSHDGVKDDVYADYSATAYAEAHGINAYYGDVNNTAPVVLVAMGGAADAQDSAGAYAYARGLVAYGDVNNTGAISVTATGGTADANDTTDAYATAYGIYAHGDANNTGAITAVAAGGTATGDDADGTATAYGIYAQGNVSNTAAITVVGDTEDGFTSHIYGIYMDATGNLTNTGVIRAEGDDTYEVYVASGTTTLVDTYNVTLDGNPAQASFFIADGATLALNDATLTVAEVQGDTRWYTQYRLFAIDSNGVVAGNFAGIEAVNPDVNAVYYTHETAAAVDDTVALEYGPRASENIASSAVEKQLVSQATDVVNYHMTSTLLQNILSPNTSDLLADAGSTAESFALAQAAPKKAAGVFIEPYYSRIDKEANPLGYDAGLWGFCVGYEQYVGDSLLGLHLGVGQSDIDYAGVGYSANSEDQDVVTGGFSGLTRWDPWTLRYGLTAFHGSHDYKGLTGLSLDEHETASYNSYGTSATLMAGHIFRKGSHIWLPEAGLNWLWAHRERYTTEATDPSWDTTYSAMNDHDLQAEAAIRWLGSFTHDEIHVAPSASVGIRHLLTDAETSARQSVTDASPVDVKSERERTAMTLSGSVTLTRTPHALSLAYDGEYSPDTQRHNVWLRYSWLF
ncbi:MAG: hypothetical protein ABFD90_02185 [Phycisphaerales bacterium]